MDLRSENSGNGGGGREKSGKRWQGAEEERECQRVNLHVENVTMKVWTRKDVLQDWN